MTNVLSLDLRRAQWPEIADFVMALRPVAYYNAIHATIAVDDNLRARLDRLIEQAGLDDYLAVAASKGLMLAPAAPRDERTAEPAFE